MKFLQKKIIFIFMVAFMVRMGYIFLIPARSLQLDDSYQWNLMAKYFKEGKGFLFGASDLDAKRAPIYPFFLAGVYRIWGDENYLAVKVFQAILSSLICVGVFILGTKLFDEPVAMLAGLFSGLYPPFIVYAEIFQSETLFCFLLLLWIYLWIKAIESNHWKYYIACGISLGILNLARGTMLFFPFFILGSTLFFRQVQLHLKKYILLILFSFLVIAPWTWRNYKVYDAFIPVVAGGPESFWYGTFSLKVQRQFGESEEFKQVQKNLSGTVKENEIFFKKNALKNIFNNPIGYLRLNIKKFLFFWYQPIGYELIANKSVYLGSISLFFHITFILLFIVGIILTMQKKEKLMPLYLIIVYFALLHTLVPPVPRYRLPIEPLMILFASVVCLKFFEYLKNNFYEKKY